jgi:hypothetical protein
MRRATNATTRWMALGIDCDGCAGGAVPQITSARFYESLDEAKTTELSDQWQDRPHGGVYGHDPSGGIEIIPLPLTYKKLSTSRRLWFNHRFTPLSRA